MLLALLWPAAASLAQGAPPSPRATLDLGATPWQFVRIVNDDLAAGKQITVTGDNFPRVFQVDLGSVQPLHGFRDTFANPEVTLVNYTLEASPDNSNWTVVVDKKDLGETPAVESATNMEKSSAGTVGAVSHPVSASIAGVFQGNFRYLRLTMDSCHDSAGQPVAPRQNSLAVYGGRTTSAGTVSSQDEARFSLPEYDDSSWESVGLPHCFNATESYLNLSYNNNPAAAIWHGTTWYRKHLKLTPGDLAGRRAWLEFDSASVGAAVYVNGRFKPGNTAVAQSGETTHVGEFLPFAVDVTDDLKAGDNLIAVRVSNAQGSFFTWPGFGTNEPFVMGFGGLNAPVRLRVAGKVGIPPDDYSVGNQWGTCIGTVSATDDEAKERVLTQVVNTDAAPHNVQLIVTFLDPNGRKALELSDTKPVASGATAAFDLSGSIAHPQLWYPNNSPDGKPWLYRVVQTVRADGQVTDQTTSQTGLRVITWDGDHCFVNGHPVLLRGFGHRNGYPGFGTAVPAELQWKDMRAIVRCGGDALRVGHVPPPRATIEACDALGILIVMNSGDDEWVLHGEPARTYKREYDRDMIVAYRNHPSVAIWESNNGFPHGDNPYLPSDTQAVVDQWDPIWPRIVSNRDGYPPNWDKSRPVVVTYTNAYRKVAGSPSMNVEVYGGSWSGKPSINMPRFDYADEKTFTRYYVNDYLSNLRDKACGWLDWMLEETEGEGYTMYLDGTKNQKSLGSCALDGNRFPKLKYRVYEKALWVDYATRPGVALQSSWNLSGSQEVDAWSNCPAVELFLNDQSLGVRKPDPQSRECTWPAVAWQAGRLRAVGLDDNGMPVCEDARVTAGDPARVVLSVEPRVLGPVRADGTDAAIITAMVVDRDGHWCPDAANNLVFSVAGEGRYLGSYNFLVQPGGKHHHAPGDPELSAEGGLMRVAVRSTFTTGQVTVTAQSPGLAGSSVSFNTQAISPVTFN